MLERQTETDWSSICWFCSQVAVTIAAGQADVRSWELHPGLSHGQQEHKHCVIICCLSGILMGNQIPSEALRTWLKHCDTGCGHPKRWLNHLATMSDISFTGDISHIPCESLYEDWESRWAISYFETSFTLSIQICVWRRNNFECIHLNADVT